ncbi:hypothetical protein BKH41_08795 [Helicobacter sp. 12S02232-10]|uniref:hypothetical protein n=1 Tax=Helicobacter sp. 12S02232-10 TaxID=1476197 RepID=UPI000BA60DB2|nr:hypothetical protein [Helicobacter sp. 12S02232-10]PAF46592.1 hypothetical protein BKH41_08795 [Helicobacter sp. 12S02232-10]
MKKILLLLCVFASFGFACFCTVDIMQGFASFRDYITNDMLIPQRKNTDSLQASIKQSKEALEKQNAAIEKLIEIEKRKALEYSQMVFLLTQKRKMLE